MKVTPNYILPQLDGDDFFDREALNDGFSKIDTAISDVQESINLLEPTSIKYVRELGDKITKSEEVLKKNEDMILNGGLATKGEIAVINSSLETKTTKGQIVASDLSTSTDAGKIKLINLSEEVQSAMAGTSPVISTVSNGSLTTEKYADNSVTINKIDNDDITKYWNIFLTQYKFNETYSVTDVGTFFKSILENIKPLAGDAITIKANMQIDKDVAQGGENAISTWVKDGSSTGKCPIVAPVGTTFLKNTIYKIDTSYTYTVNTDRLEFMLLTDFLGNFNEPLNVLFSNFEVKLNGTLIDVKYSGYQYNGSINAPARDTDILLNTNYYFGNRYNSFTTQKELKEVKEYITTSGVNVFANKKIVCFGDSLTAGDYGYEDGLPFTYGLGDMNSNTHPNIKEKNYPYFLNEYLKPLSIANRGICGAGSYFMFTDKPESASNYNFDQADIVIFMVGINEGLTGDITTDLNIADGQNYNSYAGSYLGYYARSVAKALTDNPNIQIFIVCTPKTPNTDNGRTDAFKQTVYDNTVALAKYFSIPLIDVNNLSGINPLTYSRYLNQTDKLHCNEEGYKVLAKTISNGLKQFYRV